MRHLFLIILQAAIIAIFFTALAKAVDTPPAPAVTTTAVTVKLNEQAIINVNNTITEIKTSIAAINGKLDKLRDRPSWITAAIVTFLSAACVGLLVNQSKKTAT